MQIFVIRCNSPTTPLLLCIWGRVSRRRFREFLLGIKEVCKVTLSSPCLSPPNPSFSGIRKVRKSQYEMLKLSAKCWISAFNAQGSRGIIVAVQVGAVKIYVAAVEALKKKERQGETQETIKNWWFSEFHPPPWMLMYFFAGFFFQSHPVSDQTRGTHPFFSWLYGYLYYFLSSIWLGLPDKIQ